MTNNFYSVQRKLQGGFKPRACRTWFCSVGRLVWNYIISRKCPLSWHRDPENCFLGTIFSVLWSPRSVLGRSFFAGLTTNSNTLTVLNDSGISIWQMNILFTVYCVIFIYSLTQQLNQTTEDLKLDSAWRLNYTYTLKPQAPTVILDFVTTVWLMCRYWKWLTKLLRCLTVSHLTCMSSCWLIFTLTLLLFHNCGQQTTQSEPWWPEQQQEVTGLDLNPKFTQSNSALQPVASR